MIRSQPGQWQRDKPAVGEFHAAFRFVFVREFAQAAR
jgi:hypothetical protein